MENPKTNALNANINGVEIMKKWYNFETMFRSLKEDLTAFLKESGIKYEISGCGAGWHFEVLCDTEELEKVNNWLDENTITEQ